jgi:hypothetical protein
MSHLDTAYELGVKQAEADLGAWLASGIDNPTAEPVAGYTKMAIDRMIQKLAEPRGKKVRAGSRRGGASQPAAKAPAGKGTRFKAMVKKLKKKKGVRDPGALAAAIGRSKFGKGKMQHMAAKGR